MNHSRIALLLFFLSANFIFGQDSLLTEKFKKSHHLLKYDDGQLSGKGLEFLKTEASASPFFLIGESHGIAEIPLFTAALFKELQPLGYQYFATETGPYTATMLQEMASQKEYLPAFKSHLDKYKWSLPFYGWQEECGVLAAVMEGKQDEQKPIIWGLDQEFAASFRMLFDKLKKDAQTEESKAVASEYVDLAYQCYRDAFDSKDPRKSFFGVMQPEDFTKLKKAFAGQKESLDLLKELEETVEIYSLWATGEGLKSNQLRAEMMKRHFMDYYQKTKVNDPKVLFKFGASHIYRGLNGLNVPDIGNFVSELASQQGKQSFHLYVLARKGTQNAYTPFSQSEDDKKKPYDASQYLDKVDFRTALAAVPDTEWAVIDLRPLRKSLFNRHIKNVQKGLEKIIWSYDALLIIPEVHASTNF